MPIVLPATVDTDRIWACGGDGDRTRVVSPIDRRGRSLAKPLSPSELLPRGLGWKDNIVNLERCQEHFQILLNKKSPEGLYTAKGPVLGR